ncbi:MAG TPA: hypothetical protein VFY99_00215 [Solirubrobacterales bacterium]
MSADGALGRLADLLREDGSVIADHLPEPGAGDLRALGAPLGELVAAGPRAAGAPAEYALLVEAVREGYLLHYGEPRVVRDADEDLRLLAGDYLYALGLERLAGLGDLEAVRELADLISISAKLHAERGGAGSRELWLASAVAVAAGGGARHERAKEELRSGASGAERDLLDLATDRASETGLESALSRLAESIESAPLG